MSEKKCSHCGYDHNQPGSALCLQCGAMLPDAKQYVAPGDTPTVTARPGQNKTPAAEPPTMRVEQQSPTPSKPVVNEPPTVAGRPPTPEPPTFKASPPQPAAEPPTMRVERQPATPSKPVINEPPTVASRPPTPEPPTFKASPPQPAAEPPTMRVEQQSPTPSKPMVNEPPTVAGRPPTPEPPTFKASPPQPAAEPPTMRVERQPATPPNPMVNEPPAVASRPPTPEPPTFKASQAQPAAEPPTVKVERQQQPPASAGKPVGITDMPTMKVDKKPSSHVHVPPPSSSSIADQPTVKGSTPHRAGAIQAPETPTVIVSKDNAGGRTAAGDERTVQAKPSSQQTPAARLTVKHGGRKGMTFPLTIETMSIGRWDADSGSFPEIDLTADDSDGYISRKHARIFNQEGKWFIEDSGSVNGTFVNKGARLLPKRPAELHDEDEIILGKIFFTFTLG